MFYRTKAIKDDMKKENKRKVSASLLALMISSNAVLPVNSNLNTAISYAATTNNSIHVWDEYEVKVEQKTRTVQKTRRVQKSVRVPVTKYREESYYDTEEYTDYETRTRVESQPERFSTSLTIIDSDYADQVAFAYTQDHRDSEGVGFTSRATKTYVGGERPYLIEVYVTDYKKVEYEVPVTKTRTVEKTRSVPYTDYEYQTQWVDEPYTDTETYTERTIGASTGKQLVSSNENLYPKNGEKNNLWYKYNRKLPNPAVKDKIQIARNSSLKAEDLITNKSELLEDTKYSFKNNIDTSSEGVKPNTILITYRDGSTNEVDVNIEVTSRAYLNNPKAKPIETFVGDSIKPEDGIANIGELEGVVKYEFKNTANTDTSGSYENTIVITYDDDTTDEVSVGINVKPISEKYNPDVTKEIKKDRKEVISPEDLVNNKQDLPKDTKYNYDKEIDFNKPGENNVNLVITYSDGSTDKIPVKITIRSDAEKYQPEVKEVTKDRKENVNPEEFITNKDKIPAIKYDFKEEIDTTKPGEKNITILVTYEDGTKDEVSTKLIIRNDAEKYQPNIDTEKSINRDEKVSPEDFVKNKDELPPEAKIDFKEPVDVSESGDKKVVIVVEYEDGSKDEIETNLYVRNDADNHTPEFKNITVERKEKPIADNTVKNKKELPEGTTFSFEKEIDYMTYGKKDAVVVVKYPDGSTDKGNIKITVRSDAERYIPETGNTTIERKSEPKAEDFITNKDKLPITKVDFKEKLDTETPGVKDVTLVVTYEDGSTDEVEVKIKVKTDAERYEPKAENATVERKSEPKAEDFITNKNELPDNTKYKFKEPLNTQISGKKETTIVVEYEDGSKDEVTFEITVRTDTERYEPIVGNTTIERKSEPKAEDFITNKNELPITAKYEFKEPLDTQTSGKKETTVIVTYEDGTTDEVTFEVTVRTDGERYEPKSGNTTVERKSEPKAEDFIVNKNELPDNTKYEFKEPLDTQTSGKKETTIIVTYEDKTTDEVTFEVTVKTDSERYSNQIKYEKERTINKNEKIKAEDFILNKDELPDNTKYSFKDTLDLSTPGIKETKIIVTYEDNTTTELPIKIIVRYDSENYNPEANNITVDRKSKHNADEFIKNKDKLPTGTKFEFKKESDFSKPGRTEVHIKVIYPDGSSDNVKAEIFVRTDAEKYNVETKDIELNRKDKINPKDFINNSDNLPKGIEVKLKDKIDTDTPGEKKGTIIITFEDGSTVEKDVKVRVKSDKEIYTPKAREVKSRVNKKIDPKEFISNIKDLPNTIKVEFKDKVDFSEIGRRPVNIIVTYEDGSYEELSTYVNIFALQADVFEPEVKEVKAIKGEAVYAKDFIKNFDKLPIGTKVEFKNKVQLNKTGEQEVILVITYPDGSSEEIKSILKIKQPTGNTEKSYNSKNNSYKSGHNAKTGVESVAGIAGILAAAATGYVLTKKKENE